MIMTLLKKPLVILIALVITIGVVYELGFAAENNTPAASVQQNLLESDFVTEGNIPVSSMPVASVQQNLTETGFVAASNTPIVPASFAPGTRWARVDESIGLRGEASIGGARGITGADTRIYTHRVDGIATIPAGNNPSLPITITPNRHYTLTGVTVVAFATIEHRDGLNQGWGTREVVTDIRRWDDINYSYPAPWNNSYIVPTAYFETFLRNAGTPNASRMEIEVVLYADFTYNPNLVAHFIIDFGDNDNTITITEPGQINGVERPWNGNNLPPGMSWTGFNASGAVSRGLRIDANHSNIEGRVIRLTGTTFATAGVRGAYHVLIEGNHLSADRQTVHLILDNLTMFPGAGANLTNYRELKTPSPITTQIQHWATLHGRVARYSGSQVVGTINRNLVSNTFGNDVGGVSIAPGSGLGGQWANRSPLILSNVDAFVTLRGYNIISHTDTTNQHPGTTAIYVDGSASLIFTDASDVPDASGRRGSLYARGAGCSSAIGTMHLPVGFIQIDGGKIIAESADGAHQFAGIGHGGHSENQVTPLQSGAAGVADPMLRGIVINGGEVHALGHHYGIGGNGGAVVNAAAGTGAQRLNPYIGPTYIVITGGEVQAESGAGSGGSAIGFGYNNSIHHVRIGRMDRPDAATRVIAANWGYGAAISGNMTFYSGYTTAYSGQYAAAIGGNAISWATVAIRVQSQARNALHAEEGTPLTVYGGVVRAVSGAFPQRDITETGGAPNFHINQARGVVTPGSGTVPPALAGSVIRPVWGTDSSRISLQETLKVLCCTDNMLSYGAAIGGAIRQDGGSRNQIFGGNLTIISGSHGAGIGGGGSFDANNAGSGTGDDLGDGTWFGTNHIRRNILATDTTTVGNVAPMSLNITAGRFGAGIGGGGADGLGADGGSGGNLFIGGGNFEINAGEYGAGIGGGGSISGSGGDGGNVVIGGQ